MDNSDIISLANMIHGEGASSDYDTKVMIGSTAINRMNANRPQEFGYTMPEVLQKGYYAVSNPNIPYKEAIAQKFTDDKSETEYKKSLAIASGLVKGTIKPKDGMFYFTKKEIAKLKKQGKKVFNFNVVKDVGDVGDYSVYSY